MKLFIGVPGAAHRLDHGGDPLGVWPAVVARWPGVFEGDRHAVDGDIELALAIAATRVDGLGLAVAVGPVDGALAGCPVGLGARRLREALRFAREGEVFAAPGFGELPDGVGRFDVPEVVCTAVGCRVWSLRDYR